MTNFKIGDLVVYDLCTIKEILLFSAKTKQKQIFNKPLFDQVRLYCVCYLENSNEDSLIYVNRLDQLTVRDFLRYGRKYTQYQLNAYHKLDTSSSMSVRSLDELKLINTSNDFIRHLIGVEIITENIF